MTTLPPPATIMRAVAAPSPDAPPVTMNVLPCRFHGCVLDRARRCCDVGVACTTVIAVAMRPAMSATFAGTISVLLVRARCANASMYCSATFRLTACMPPGASIASAICADRLGIGLGVREDRLRLALRVVDLRLLLAFGLGDRRLARADRDVDLLLPLALGRGDHRALLALGGDLRLHRAQDLRRRRQVLDLVAQHLDAPASPPPASSAATTGALIWSRSSNVLSSSMRPITLRSVVCASCVIAST